LSVYLGNLYILLGCTSVNHIERCVRLYRMNTQTCLT